MDGGRSGRERLLLAGVLVATGFSSVGLQVLWQRMVAMQVGVDALSSAIVVGGFLGGLSVGSFVAARLADRLAARTMVWLFAGAEAVVAVMALASVSVLYDLFGAVAPGLGPALVAVVGVTVVVVPAVLMGVSIPSAAAFIGRRSDAPATGVGQLYAANTVGAALGAFVTGWFLIGELGFRGASVVCAVVGASAALLLVGLALSASPADESSAVLEGATPDAVAGGADGVSPRLPLWPWYLAYAISGGLTLGLQQAFFRLTSAIQRANSYSFATVLAMYLLAFAVGVALAAPVVRRLRDPRRWFLWLQFGVGAAALASLTIVVRVMPRVGLGERMSRWFNSDGVASGFSSSPVADLVVFAVFLPLIVVGPAVVLMGASFPVVEQIVLERSRSVGGGTGRLLAANTLGNFVGTFAVALVLFDLLGTSGTVLVLSGCLMVGGVIATAIIDGRQRRGASFAALALGVLLILAAPGNVRLWQHLSGDPGEGQMLLAEDAACAAVIERQGDSAQLALNGATQNGYPFDDFHILIGLLPSLAADSPGDGLVVGHGIGSTAYAMLGDVDRRSVTTVELCGGTYPLSDTLAEEGYDEFARLRDDPRHERIASDGRRHLQRSTAEYDAIVVDTLRITSAGSGQHFSTEFYRLVDERLADDGVFAQWVPTWRTQNSAAKVFPYLVTMEVAEYGDSVLMLGSRSPIDTAVLHERFLERAAAAFEPEQRARLEEFLATSNPTCVTDGEVVAALAPEFENSDLFPRDEYHRNNGFIGETQTATTC